MQLLPTTSTANPNGFASPIESLCTRSRLSEASAQAYARDMKRFLAEGFQFPCDVEVLRRYLLNHRKLSPSTLHRRCQAIRHAHLSQGLPSPTADPVMVKIMRALHRGVMLDKKILEGAEPDAGARRRAPASAAPISRAMLERMLAPLPRNMADLRDRALVLIMFGAALRRAEAVAIDIGGISFTPDVLLVEVGTRRIAIPRTGGDLCAAKTCREFFDRSGWDVDGTTGPFFRRAERGGALSQDRLDPGAVNLIIKRLVAATGADPARYSAESLRRGRLMEMAKGKL